MSKIEVEGEFWIVREGPHFQIFDDREEAIKEFTSNKDNIDSQELTSMEFQKDKGQLQQAVVPQKDIIKELV